MSGTRDPIDSMAPWDAVPYFQTPTEVGVSVAGNTPTQLCKANPQRVALIFSSSALGSATVSINPKTVQTTGMTVGGTVPPIMLPVSIFGPLVTMEWFGFATGNTTITVYEVVLSKWPKVKVPAKKVQRANATRGTNGNGRRG